MRFACRNREELQLCAYGFLEGPEAAVVESHLQGCAECSEELERLVRERQVVAFELSLETGVSEAAPAAPAPPPAQEAPGRRLRLPRPVVPALIAAAAAVLVLAALSALLTVDPVDPGPTDWTRLPDGSRYHAVDGATIGEGRRLRSITLEQGALVIDVEPAERAFTIRTPHGSVRSDGGRLQVSVSAAGTHLEVTGGQAQFTPSDEPREIRIEGAGGDDWSVIRDWNAMLFAYVFELEAELARLRAGAEPLAVADRNPAETLDEIDWSALGMEGATIAEIARDPRAGPRLFRTVVAQAWPQASEAAPVRDESGTGSSGGSEVGEPASTGGDPAPAEAPPVNPSGTTGSSIGASGQSTATDILRAAGFSSKEDLVYRGPVDYLVKYVVEDWLRDHALPRTLKADLKRLALRWVSDYRDRLRIEDRDVVAALEAGLGRGSVPAGVKTSSVFALRERLLEFQATAEKSLLALLTEEGLRPAERPASRPTFFLVW